MLYFKIKEPDRAVRKQGVMQRGIRFFLELIIPKANPDYEKKIDSVVYWLLEFESKRSTPEREIGLDSNEEVIVKMPYKNNYGYWVDNSLTLEGFQKTFKVEEITKEYFDEKWKVEPVG